MPHWLIVFLRAFTLILVLYAWVTFWILYCQNQKPICRTAWVALTRRLLSAAISTAAFITIMGWFGPCP